MGFMIQIEESKFDKMSEYAEKMLKYGGKIMSCLEEIGDEHGMGHRGGYGNRSGRYGGDMGYRHEDRMSPMGQRESDDDWDDDYMMNQRRRRRDSRGRYM